jgi:trk system potassium uptake protein TrkA
MKRVVVIGLGIFGSQLARQLYESGLEVVAIDKNRDVVQRIKDHSTKAVLADATDKEVLESIGPGQRAKRLYQDGAPQCGYHNRE